MCFSPEADLVAGIVIGVIGVDAFRHVRSPRERPLAALPIVFAFHQLIEVVVWRGLQGHVDSGVWHAAAWLYLAVAFGVVPVLVPFAVAALEPEEHRARARSFVLLGALVAAVLMFCWNVFCLVSTTLGASVTVAVCAVSTAALPARVQAQNSRGGVCQQEIKVDAQNYHGQKKRKKALSKNQEKSKLR